VDATENFVSNVWASAGRGRPAKNVLHRRSRRNLSRLGVIEAVEYRGVGQNLSPSPSRVRRFFGGGMVVVRSWKAKWIGRSKYYHAGMDSSRRQAL